MARLSAEAITLYVEAKLRDSANRNARLDLFVRGNFQRVPGASMRYAVVECIYFVWCRERRELFREGEAARLLERAGYRVRAGAVGAIGLRPLANREAGTLNDSWWDASKTAELSGIPRASLQVMRDAGDVGPVWRTCGHQFLYSVESVRQFLAGCHELIPEERPKKLVAWFLSERCLFRGEYSERRAALGAACVQFVFEMLGVRPKGLRRELWAQLHERGYRDSRPRLDWTDPATGKLKRRPHVIEGISLLRKT